MIHRFPHENLAINFLETPWLWISTEAVTGNHLQWILVFLEIDSWRLLWPYPVWSFFEKGEGVVSYCMMPTSCQPAATPLLPLHRAPRASLNHRPTRQLRRGRTGRVFTRREDVGLKSGDQRHKNTLVDMDCM